MKTMWLVGQNDEFLCSPTPWEWNGDVELNVWTDGYVAAQGFDWGDGDKKVSHLYGKPNFVKRGDRLTLQAPRQTVHQ